MCCVDASPTQFAPVPVQCGGHFAPPVCTAPGAVWVHRTQTAQPPVQLAIELCIMLLKKPMLPGHASICKIDYVFILDIELTISRV
jgi:hypothetical protein